jgi:hypothetical protein
VDWMKFILAYLKWIPTGIIRRQNDPAVSRSRLRKFFDPTAHSGCCCCGYIHSSQLEQDQASVQEKQAG